MVRYRRNWLPGGTFFFTVALEDRRTTWLTSHVALLRQSFRQARRERPFRLDAYVILPDHLHAILTLPPGDADFANRWRVIKGDFTRRLRKSGVPLRKRDGASYVLWQRRYWEHTIRDDADYAQHVDYIHFNPTKHGRAERPANWPHSSMRCFVRHGILATDWGVAPEETEQFFGEPGR